MSFDLSELKFKIRNLRVESKVVQKIKNTNYKKYIFFKDQTFFVSSFLNIK
jgi:hypothetical protein